MTVRLSRRQCLSGLAALLTIAPTGCIGGGHFSILGYSTRPNYDSNIKTVYVPIFQNQAFQAGPFRNLEFDLTRAVIKEIESKTPYKVISDPDRADTELLCRLVANNKGIFNYHQLNEVRDGQIILTVEVVWRDMRTGKVLSNRRGATAVRPAEVPQLDPNAAPIIEGPEKAYPVVLVAQGRFLPELGESTTTGIQMAVNRMSVQIVSLMESDWSKPADCACPPAP